jgi:acetyltransferase
MNNPKPEVSSDLNKLFFPSAVAVIGVSKDPSKLGTRTFLNVLNGGYPGPAYPIGRDLGEIAGVRGYDSIGEVPGKVDVVYMSLPADRTPQGVRDCAAAGVSFVIIGASGFAELNTPEGIARQQELDDIVRTTGIRIIGPNCNGIYSTPAHLALGFNTGHSRRLRRGNIAILSHSGALFDPMLQLMEPLGGALSMFVSAGNQGDLDVLDYMEFLIGDDSTRVIALLLDSLSSGPRFRELATRARAAGKSVIALKIGVSEVGAKAATAHSSRLTGSAAAYLALFRASGVAAANSLEGFVAGAVLLSRFGFCQGGLGAFSTSGAGGSLIADIAARHRVSLPDYGAATYVKLAVHQRFAGAANPTDIGVFNGIAAVEPLATAIASDPAIGMLLMQFHRLPGKPNELLSQAAIRAGEVSGKGVVVLVPGDLADDQRALISAAGLPFFVDTDTCLQGIAACFTPPPVAVAHGVPRSLPLSAGGGALTEPDSLELLAACGVNTVPLVRCRSAAEAEAAAVKLGWPVVVKGVAKGIAHKSEAGLVHTQLSSASQLHRAHAAMGVEECIVQPMVAGKAEAIVGIATSEDTGMQLIAGLGGVFTEALQSVTTWSIPVDRNALEGQLDDSPLGRLLASPRWNGALARSQLVDMLLSLQAFALAAADRLEAVDVNPVILGADGAVAVDGLVVLRPAPRQ